METTERRSVGARDAVALVAWLAVAGGLAALTFTTRRDMPDDLLYRYELALGTTIGLGMLAGVSFLISLLYAEPLGALGLRRFAWRWVGIALGLIVLVAIVSLLLEPILEAGRQQGLAPAEWRPERAAAFAVNALVIATVVPFGEELFFRGLGIRVLAPVGEPAALAVTALAFALAHGILVAVPPLLLFGVAAGWVRLRSRSVWPAMIAHGTYNAIGIAVILIALFLDLA